MPRQGPHGNRTRHSKSYGSECSLHCRPTRLLESRYAPCPRPGLHACGGYPIDRGANSPGFGLARSTGTCCIGRSRAIGGVDDAYRVRQPTMTHVRWLMAHPAAKWLSAILLQWFCVGALASHVPPIAKDQDRPVDSALSRGEYLARIGDCVACHTKQGGEPFAGGFAMPTPFGTLYSPNITPDDVTGIGQWTADEFYRMLHTGHSRDGTLLYPAMPFPAYTKVTREDCDAIFTYLRTLKPVSQPNRENELRFPYNNRSLMYGWRALYFTEGTFKPLLGQSAEFNRGAYLVQGLGHCASCHSTINALGGSSEDSAFAGGLIPLQNWYAPSLTSNQESGLGSWSVVDIAALLKTGASMRGAVYGPMAAVTHNSRQYLTNSDATAIAIYLKSLLESKASAPRAAEG